MNSTEHTPELNGDRLEGLPVGARLEGRCEAEELAPLRVALVGVSGYADAHLKLISAAVDRGLFQLVATAVLNQAEEPERCAHVQSLGGRIFDDFSSMISSLSGEVDICFIPTGIHHHAWMTLAALEAGANVLVEKPAAATIQDIRRMKEAEARSGRFVAVGFQNIYDSVTSWMKRVILGGEIGRVVSIKSRALWPRYNSYYARNNWAGRIELDNQWVLDSPFNNALAHQLNLMCFLAGPELHRSARVLSVEAELYRSREIESADTACIRIRTESDVPLYFYASHSCEDELDPELEVVGEFGRIRWSLQRASLIKDDVLVHEETCGDFGSLHRMMTDALVTRSFRQDAFVCDLDIAEAHTLCVNGAHESSAIHQLPDHFLKRSRLNDGDHRVSIHGIDATIDRAFREERLFSEIGTPWAVPGRVFKLEGYESFHGGAGAGLQPHSV